MRLGGPVLSEYSDPETWITALRGYGYRAAFCPIKSDADDGAIEAFADAAERADVVIAEVGAWGSNPLSLDEEIRCEALRRCQEQLALADRIGARCCVNSAGRRGQGWYNPFDDETFDNIVESVQAIIDAVKPARTFYTLEVLPGTFPDSADSYLRLIKAIDRKQFAVHFDPVNAVSSPRRYYDNGSLIREFVAKLGPHIRSCHAKDILLEKGFPVYLQETRPGLGKLEYNVLLRELSKLDPDTPLMLEHLSTGEEYALAADHIRSVAEKMGLTM